MLNTLIKDASTVVKLKEKKQYLRFLDICEFGAGFSDKLHDEVENLFYENSPKDFNCCDFCTIRENCCKDANKIRCPYILTNKVKNYHFDYTKAIDYLRTVLIDCKSELLTIEELKEFCYEWVWLSCKDYDGDNQIIPVFIEEIYNTGKIEVTSISLNYIYYDKQKGFTCNEQACKLFKHKPEKE